MITFFDHHESVAGGQLVLAELINRIAHDAATALVGPKAAGIRTQLPASTRFVDAERPTAPIATGALGGGANCHVLVANTYATIVAVRRTGRRLRKSGAAVTTVAILHSYPSSRLRRIVARRLLSAIDSVIVVEPGLGDLAPRVTPTPMLSVRPEQVRTLNGAIRRSGDVKSFGRSDRVKGMDQIPAVAIELEREGLNVHVALAPSIDGNPRYATELREALAPWLESGPRDPSWLVPGDIFLVTSRSETTCLAAQEAMAAGAFVVAPRVGAMTTLETDGNSLTTYPPGDMRAAVDRVLSIAAMPNVEYDSRCRTGNDQMRTAAGAWYLATAAALTSALAGLARGDEVVRP